MKIKTPYTVLRDFAIHFVKEVLKIEDKKEESKNDSQYPTFDFVSTLDMTCPRKGEFSVKVPWDKNQKYVYGRCPHCSKSFTLITSNLNTVSNDKTHRIDAGHLYQVRFFGVNE